MTKSDRIESRIYDLERINKPSGVEIHTLAYLRWLLANMRGGHNPYERPAI